MEDRPDAVPALTPFMERLALSLFPDQWPGLSQWVTGGNTDPIKCIPEDLILTFCIQAPPELFQAAGLMPLHLACGSHAAAAAAPLNLPALTCPLIKSAAGRVAPHLKALGKIPLVLPLTCDWTVRFGELAGLFPPGDIPDHVHLLELPRQRRHVQSEARFLSAIKALKDWLEDRIQRKITPRDILRALEDQARAALAFEQLRRRRRRGEIPHLHFALITNALAWSRPGEWTDWTRAYLNERKPTAPSGTPVFLTGSPLVFPNYKLFFLAERAGLSIQADDVCTLERAFNGPVPFRDKSEHALLSALAQRHHTACSCPVFADNRHRMNALVQALEQDGIRGVIFHALKGCHPFDMDAGILERQLKDRGIRFLKIETDYVKEDEQTLLTRLEAFGRSLTKE